MQTRVDRTISRQSASRSPRRPATLCLGMSFVKAAILLRESGVSFRRLLARRHLCVRGEVPLERGEVCVQCIDVRA
jgi:hypothetical protein